jgi:2-oxoglutarate dehydrogenase E2 component (dihydrolipoamide succinyltransferase)
VVSELEKPLQVVPSTPQEFSGDLYLSPLVKSIAEQEGISEAELKSIKGTGLEGRITKEDILDFVKTAVMSLIQKELRNNLFKIHKTILLHNSPILSLPIST